MTSVKYQPIVIKFIDKKILSSTSIQNAIDMLLDINKRHTEIAEKSKDSTVLTISRSKEMVGYSQHNLDMITGMNLDVLKVTPDQLSKLIRLRSYLLDKEVC